VKDIIKEERGKIIITDPLACSICMQCVEICPKNAIKVELSEDSFIFNVETVSGLKPEEIVENAAKILDEKAGEFSKVLGKLK
jgi:formate hydrogenlyase subunit 6/NADH:ubiquinone oxidoreductase subunit I